MVRLLALALTLAAGPVRACGLALALTIDVSGSIDPGEYRFQMDGLADALEDPAVADALVLGQAAVMVLQWSGAGEQDISIPWRRMLRPGDISDLAAQVRATPRRWQAGKTAIGDALSRVMAEFDKVSDCTRKVIDISGDGMTNDGTDTVAQRRLARASGFTVNGVAIDRIGKSITQYYSNFVAVGPGHFVMTSRGYTDYPRAIRLKLLREVTVPAS